MDCKLEPASRTAVRMILLGIQGVLYGLAGMIAGLVLIPKTIWDLMASRVYYQRNIDKKAGVSGGWRFAILFIAWGVQASIFALVSPLSILCYSLRMTAEVIHNEWRDRWRASVPKRVDGTPLDIE